MDNEELYKGEASCWTLLSSCIRSGYECVELRWHVDIDRGGFFFSFFHRQTALYIGQPSAISKGRLQGQRLCRGCSKCRMHRYGIGSKHVRKWLDPQIGRQRPASM